MSCEGRKKKIKNGHLCLNDFNSITADDFCDEGSLKEDYSDCEGAIESFSKAIELNPDCIEAYFSRGLLQKKLGKIQEAMSDFSKCINISTDYQEAYIQRGLLKSIHSFEEGLKDIDKAISINPSSSNAHFHRGKIMLEIIRYNYLKKNKKETDEVKIKEEIIIKGLIGLDIVEQYEKALLFIDRAVELDCENPEALSIRDSLRKRLGKNKDDSIEKIKSYLDNSQGMFLENDNDYNNNPNHYNQKAAGEMYDKAFNLDNAFLNNQTDSNNYEKNIAPIVFLMILLWLFCFVIAGYVSWNLIKPESFGEAVIFLIIWSALSFFLKIVLMFLGNLFKL